MSIPVVVRINGHTTNSDIHVVIYGSGCGLHIQVCCKDSGQAETLKQDIHVYVKLLPLISTNKLVKEIESTFNLQPQEVILPALLGTPFSYSLQVLHMSYIPQLIFNFLKIQS